MHKWEFLEISFTHSAACHVLIGPSNMLTEVDIEAWSRWMEAHFPMKSRQKFTVWREYKIAESEGAYQVTVDDWSVGRQIWYMLIQSMCEKGWEPFSSGTGLAMNNSTLFLRRASQQ